MKLFNKQTLLFAIVFMVAIIGLLHIAHQEAYAIGNCATWCDCGDWCRVGHCYNNSCACGGIVVTCGVWCNDGC